MIGRIIPLALVLMISAACSYQVLAADPQLHEGTVVSATAGKLTIKDMAGKDQSFSIDGTTKVTVNGKPGRLEDLKESMPVQVMVDDKGKVLTISTVDKAKKVKGDS